MPPKGGAQLQRDGVAKAGLESTVRTWPRTSVPQYPRQRHLRRPIRTLAARASAHLGDMLKSTPTARPCTATSTSSKWAARHCF